MLDYETSMAIGAARYSRYTSALRRAGWRAEFTQTGGMCLALEITLEGGHYVLVVDGEEPLSWTPEENEGWGAGFYVKPEVVDAAPELDGALAFETCSDVTEDSLIRLVAGVVGSGTQELLRRRRGRE